jgi:hypothetical protein
MNRIGDWLVDSGERLRLAVENIAFFLLWPSRRRDVYCLNLVSRLRRIGGI